MCLDGFPAQIMVESVDLGLVECCANVAVSTRGGCEIAAKGFRTRCATRASSIAERCRRSGQSGRTRRADRKIIGPLIGRATSVWPAVPSHRHRGVQVTISGSQQKGAALLGCMVWGVSNYA